MVDRAKLLERLMATFVDELAEHVESLNAGVLDLESQTDADQRQETLVVMFRAAHSLKGASRAVDILPIEAVCHQLEEVFTSLRDGAIAMTPLIGSTVLAVSDAIASAGDLLRARDPVAETHFGNLAGQLKQIAAGETPSGDSAPPTTSSEAGTQVAEPATEPVANAVAGSNVAASDIEPQPDKAVEKNPEATAVQESAGNATAADVVSREQGKDSIDATPQSEAALLAKTDTEDSASESAADEKPVSAPSRRGLGTTVRVAEEKLDSLMAQAGELLVARQQIEVRPGEIEATASLVAECRSEFHSIQRSLLTLIQQNGRDPLMRRSARLCDRMEQIVEQTGEKLRRVEDELEGFQQRLMVDSRQLNHTGESLQEDIHRIRMLPFSDGCAGLDRAVRDTAQATGKQVDFAIEGAEIEIDRTVLEGLRDPLLHLVRNSIDHGLETPEERVRSGKAEAGRVRISASLRGSQVDITVSDDGRGLNREAILQKIRSKGLPAPRDDHELYRSIFLPGFSTAKMVTGISGRGVGMDVVKSQLESLHGTIDLSSQPGFGTRFSLSVPLTLTTISALFVRAGGQVFTLPSTNVSRLVNFTAGDVRTMGGQDVLSLSGAPVPVVTLLGALDMPGAKSAPASGKLTGVLLTTGDRELVVIVDQLINEREVVVKNLGPQIRRIRHVSGATLLRSGGVSLLLNVATLVRSKSTSGTIIPDSEVSDGGMVLARRVLVVDDSVTTRSLMKGILESAGYDVTAAVDGQDAWKRLQNSDIELVVSDVDMPNMDGFTLTSAIRKSADFEHLPVILVTSRDSDEDKARGVESGASAYLVKSSFQQSDVLDTVELLL